MKTLITLLLILGSSAAFGQTIDDFLQSQGGRIIGAAVSGSQAKQEREQLRAKTAEYNSNQPEAPLRGRTAEVRMPHDYSIWGQAHQDWFRDELEHIFMQKAVALTPTWDTDQILSEAARLDALSKNDWVDQGTMPRKGSIAVGELIIETDYIMFEKSSDLEVWWGRWLRGVSIHFSSEMTYIGLIVKVRLRSGKAIASYKTLGIASSADNVAGNVISGFTGAGFRSSSESEQDRRWRALQNALNEMSRVLRNKAV